MQGDAAAAQQIADGDVPRIGPAVAGFFVGPDGLNGQTIQQIAQDRDGLADSDHQWSTQRRKICPQRTETLGDEGPVATGGIRLGPVSGLGDVERQDRAAPCGFDEYSVVVDPEVALEPDQLQGFHQG